MIRRNILPDEVKERTFLGLEQLEVNLEYKIQVSYCGELQVERQGGILPKSTESYRYEIGGTVIVKPLTRRFVGEDDASYNYENYHVEVECCLGEQYGAGVKRKGTAGHRIGVSGTLKAFCEQFFPNMGIYGKVILATGEQLPGDTSEQTVVDLLIAALNASSAEKISKAHKTFLAATGINVST